MIPKCTNCGAEIPSGTQCETCEAALIERASIPSLGSLFNKAKAKGLISDEPTFGS